MRDALRPTISWSKAICKEPGDYIGWPTIGRKADGELMVVFSGRRELHWCPYGQTELVRSVDAGESWSEPQVINNTPLDDRDAGIVVMRSGTIIVSWFTGQGWKNLDRYHDRAGESTVDAWRRHYKKIGDETIGECDGHWTIRSTDGGETWEPPVDSIATAPHGPIELNDGTLLFVGNAELDGQPRLVSASSDDEGKSWRQIGVIDVPEELRADLAFHEPHTVEVAEGKIICLWRHVPRDRPTEAYLQQCESEDGGRTWTLTHPTPMWGFPPHLIKTEGGAVLATYGRRRAPFGQRACLSYDDGSTWDIENEIVLRDDAPNGDLGYPSTIELEAGQFLTVYYQVDQPGEQTSLVATRWSLG